MATAGFLIEDGVLKKYTGPGGDVTVPDGVTVIGDRAFEHCEGLRTAVIPDSVESVGSFAFRGCPRLEAVRVGDGVRKIGLFAFAECGALSEVWLGKNVFSVDWYHFKESAPRAVRVSEDSKTLLSEDGAVYSRDGKTLIYYPSGREARTVAVPDRVEVIGKFAFRYCAHLETVRTGDGVREIEAHAFLGCAGLKEVFLGRNVRLVNHNAFDRSGLRALAVSEENPDLLSEDGVLYSRDGKTLLLYPPEKADKQAVIPEHAEVIGSQACRHCARVESVKTGDGVRAIHLHAFADCAALAEITLGRRVPFLHFTVFQSTRLRAVHVSPENPFLLSRDGVVYSADGTRLIYYPPRKEEPCFTVPDGVAEICPDAGRRVWNEISLPRSLRTMTLPEGAGMETYLFRGTAAEFAEVEILPELPACVRCTDGRWERTVTGGGHPRWRIVDDRGFVFDAKDRTKLIGYEGDAAEATVPDGVSEIGDGAFRNREGLRQVLLPDSVGKIGDFAFSGCAGLESVRIPDKVRSLGEGAFYNCRGLVRAALPEVIETGGYAFCGCAGLESVEMPKVRTVGRGAFLRCGRLKITAFPAALQKIRFQAFSGCVRLQALRLPEGLREIEDDAFSGCTGLVCAAIPDSVERLGRWIFFGCENLDPEYVVLPDRFRHRLQSLFTDRDQLDWRHRRWRFPEEKEIHDLECARRGFYTEAVWNLDQVIPQTLADMLEVLAWGHFASPTDMTGGEWDGILKKMAEKFRNAYTLRATDLGDDLLRSMIGQCLEKPELEGALETIPEHLIRAYREGTIPEVNRGNRALNEIADREMKEGFDLLKEYLWMLWD